jgi:hypothetical protein
VRVRHDGYPSPHERHEEHGDEEETARFAQPMVGERKERALGGDRRHEQEESTVAEE